jgi:hypothetical protein
MKLRETEGKIIRVSELMKKEKVERYKELTDDE